jgi:hypothetical protein
VCSRQNNWPGRIAQNVEVNAEGRACLAHLTKDEAEQLLDWLQSNGYCSLEVAYEEGHGFAVQWRSRHQP